MLKQALRMGGLTADPASAAAGDFYYNSSSQVLRYYNGSVWTTVASGGSSYTYTAVATQTTTYTANATTDLIPVDPAAATFVVTLPSAASATRPITINNVNSASATANAFLNAVTIAATGGDTVNGAASTSVNLIGESVTVYPTGTDWVVTQRHIDSTWRTFGPNVITSPFGSNPTKATIPTLDTIRWRRIGSFCEVKIDYLQLSTTGGANGSGDYAFSVPTNVPMDGTQISFYPSNDLTPAATGEFINNGLGFCLAADQNGNCITAQVVAFDATTVRFFGIFGNGASFNRGAVGSSLIQLAQRVQYHTTFLYPVAGWNG